MAIAHGDLKVKVIGQANAVGPTSIEGSLFSCLAIDLETALEIQYTRLAITCSPGVTAILCSVQSGKSNRYTDAYFQYSLSIVRLSIT